MSPDRRALSSIRDRWAAIRPGSAWAGAAVVVVAWGLTALGRLGGLALDAPRSLTRLTVVGIWGWLALAVTVWAIARVTAPDRGHDVRSLQLTFAVVGFAHVPIIVLASVILIAAGALRVLGPGRLVAVVSLFAVMPLALITGAEHVFGLRTRRAAAIVFGPYVVWLALVARPSLEKVDHLL